MIATDRIYNIIMSHWDPVQMINFIKEYKMQALNKTNTIPRQDTGFFVVFTVPRVEWSGNLPKSLMSLFFFTPK